MIDCGLTLYFTSVTARTCRVNIESAYMPNLCGLVCSHPKVQKHQLVRPNVYSFSLHTLGAQTC